MKQLLTMLAAAIFAVVSVAAVAQPDKKGEPKKMDKSMSKEAPKKEMTAAQKQRQEKMKACNAQATERNLKGDERKKFVSSCVRPAKAKPAADKAKPMAEEKKKK